MSRSCKAWNGWRKRCAPARAARRAEPVPPMGYWGDLPAPVSPLIMPASWPRDAWPHSGFDPAARDSDGKLLPGDHLLRTWWCRPEVAPVEASCDAERALHAAL
ncbi:DUF6352 family protein, partial [Cupriavidus basilensis]|uniref:DUF6352 family protein n=1 Tax=Cupriavidus basilensis TaxID=68895 RepID=UPI003204F904